MSFGAWGARGTTRGVRVTSGATDVHRRLNFWLIEKAALSGDDMDQQTEYAYAEIKRQIQGLATESGGIPRLRNDILRAAKASGIRKAWAKLHNGAKTLSDVELALLEPFLKRLVDDLSLLGAHAAPLMLYLNSDYATVQGWRQARKENKMAAKGSSGFRFKGDA